MIAAIAVNEARNILRSGAHVFAAIAILVLIVAAAAVSASRTAALEREERAAAAADRAVWDGQGERNPHSAAHFSRYAFRPVPPLSSFDPGVADYAGQAIWMEAHNRNLAVFRRAEETADSSALAALSPAWVLQYPFALVLLLFLFGAVAGERERGTLRQVLAAGVDGKGLFAGKIAGAALIAGALVLPAIAASLLMAPRGGAAFADLPLRIGALAGAYAVFFATTAAIAVGVSALFRRQQSALVALVALWAFSSVAVPRIAADAARLLHPAPDAGAVARDLRAASDEYWVNEKYMEADRQRLLAEYGVDDVAKLPFNFDAYTLQQSEILSHPLFDKVYADLSAAYARQDGIVRLFAPASPALALSQLSAGLAGGDRLHQEAFANDAEAQRRALVERLNKDMETKAGAAGYEYKADPSLWKEIRDFEHAPPTIASLAPHYGPLALTLLAQLVLAVLFAAAAVSHAARRAAA